MHRIDRRFARMDDVPARDGKKELLCALAFFFLYIVAFVPSNPFILPISHRSEPLYPQGRNGHAEAECKFMALLGIGAPVPVIAQYTAGRESVWKFCCP